MPLDDRQAAVNAGKPSPGGRDRDSRSAEFELRLLRQLGAFQTQFRNGKDIPKVTRGALRASMDLLVRQVSNLPEGRRQLESLPHGCVAILTPGNDQVEIVFSTPQQTVWDRELLTAFLRGGDQRIPGNIALGRLRRRGRMWGVLAVRSPSASFKWSHREALSSLAAAANEILDRIDQERVQEVHARLFARCWLRPKDLFYQVLHGLESLTHYDHSASLLIHQADSTTLEVVAEAITWKKGKSDKVGLKLPVPPQLQALLRPGVVYGFNRTGNDWQEWTGLAAGDLARFLDLHAPDGTSTGAPVACSMLCANLATPDRILGLLKVTAKHTGAFGPYEAELVEQFLPHVSIALQNSQRTEALERNLLQAERKHAMADLARGVAHDVNNALGAVLPLVQQLRAESTAGEIDPVSLGEDLRQIESSMQTCRRIFGGMLSFARGSQPSQGANIRQAIENTRTILKETLERCGIKLEIDVQAALPSIHGSQADLDQLFLNLVTNSRDAMPQGGRLSITARREGNAVHLSVQDTGTGIPPENLARVEEPFFTTKAQGNGLGLSICRSIVWQLQGKFTIKSELSAGTCVSVIIPIVSAGDS